VEGEERAWFGVVTQTRIAKKFLGGKNRRVHEKGFHGCSRGLTTSMARPRRPCEEALTWLTGKLHDLVEERTASGLGEADALLIHGLENKKGKSKMRPDGILQK